MGNYEFHFYGNCELNSVTNPRSSRFGKSIAFHGQLKARRTQTPVTLSFRRNTLIISVCAVGIWPLVFECPTRRWE